MSEPNGEQAALELERAELCDDIEDSDPFRECWFCGEDADYCGCMMLFDDD